MDGVSYSVEAKFNLQHRTGTRSKDKLRVWESTVRSSQLDIMRFGLIQPQLGRHAVVSDRMGCGTSYGVVLSPSHNKICAFYSVVVVDSFDIDSFDMSFSREAHGV